MTDMQRQLTLAHRLRVARHQGQPLNGLFVDIPHERVVAIAREAGYDFCFFDLEHGLLSLAELRQMIHLTKALGMGSLCRISDLDVALASRILDEGADGLVLAHARRPEQVQHLVARALYPPGGERGLDARAAQVMREVADWVPRVQQMNDDTLLFAILEDEEGLAMAQQIANVPGLSGILVGWGDLGFLQGSGRRRGRFTTEDAVAVARFIEESPDLASMGFTPPDRGSAGQASLRTPDLLLTGTVGGVLRSGISLDG